MRSRLGHITASLCSSLQTVTASKLLPLQIRRAKQGSKPWICQQCYHSQSQKPPRPRASASIIASKYDQTAFVKKSRTPKASLSTTSKRPANDDEVQNPRKDLPSQEEGRRSQASKRFSHVMDHLQSNIFIAGQRLNDLTGYSGIEALKKDIGEQGRSMPPTRALMTLI